MFQVIWKYVLLNFIYTLNAWGRSRSSTLRNLLIETSHSFSFFLRFVSFSIWPNFDYAPHMHTHTTKFIVFMNASHIYLSSNTFKCLPLSRISWSTVSGIDVIKDLQRFGVAQFWCDNFSVHTGLWHIKDFCQHTHEKKGIDKLK